MKLLHQQITSESSTLITTLPPLSLFIVATPSVIGFPKDFSCHFHLGSIWICLLLPPSPERFLQNDFEDGTPDSYHSSGYCLQKTPPSQLVGHRVPQIIGVSRSFPVLQLVYQFDQSGMNWFAIIIGSPISTLMCGIHPRSALGITSRNSLQHLTSLPTLLPPLVFRTPIETEWFHVSLLMGYLLLFLLLYSFLVPITLRKLIAE